MSNNVYYLSKMLCTKGGYDPGEEREPSPFPRYKPKLYAIYKDNRLVRTDLTLSQAMRFVARAVRDASGIVLVGEAMRLGYQIKAIA